MIFKNMTNYTVPVDDSYIELFDAEYDSYVLHPWTWVNPKGGTPNYVFMLPVVAFISLVCNIVIILVIVKEKMISSTNIIMMGIAVSDTLTVVSPTPLLIYIYSCGFEKFIPFHICVHWEFLMKNVCSVTHTGSVWLTMYLGINRYLGVCHPFAMRRRCTTKTTIQTIIFVYVLSVLFHLCRFMDTKYVPQIVSNASSTNTCLARYADWLDDKDTQKTYEYIYHWCHIICICFIPCTTLVILDTLMLRQIRRSEVMRNAYMTGSCRSRQKSKQSESIRTTKVIVTILAIVCVLELTLGTLLVLWTFEMMGVVYDSDFEEYLGSASTVVNFAIYISYPFIFLLYCYLSSRFRHGFRKFFRLNGNFKRKSSCTQMGSLRGVT